MSRTAVAVTGIIGTVLLVGVAVAPVNVMDHLSIRADHREDVQRVREEIGGRRRAVRAEIGGLRREARAEIGGLRKEMRAEIGGLRKEMRDEIAALRRGIHGLREELRVVGTGVIRIGKALSGR